MSESLKSPLPGVIDDLWEQRSGLSPADTAARTEVAAAVDEIDAGNARVAFVDPATDNSNVLVLRLTGGTWTINNAPNAGGPGFTDIPGGIANIDGRLWMAGTYTTASSNNLPLIEHR